MGMLIHTGRRLTAVLVAAGTLSLGAAGVAGAATTPATPAVHVNCARAPQALTRIERAESRIAAGLPRLNQAERRAAADGHPRRAHRLARRIARLESSSAHTRLTRRSAAIEAACHVSAPATSAPATGPAA
jgi:hypothetical protein